MSGRLTRREFVKGGTLAATALSLPFICKTLAHAASEIDPAALKKYRTKLKGQLILPGDPGYDSARRIWNPRYDKHPAMVARCASTEDVLRSIEFARGNELVVSVRSGGHDQGGFSTNDGGLVIDLAGLKEIRVDRTHATVAAGGGVLIGELYHAVARSGMGVVSGGCHSVGIGGLTLGGGQSALSNKYGLACDNLLSMQVVTADGRVLSASAADNPDLFWALRGGSGNFGVVTAFRYRLIPIERVVVAGATYPIGQRREVLRFFRDFLATAPDELTAEVEFGFPYPAGVFGLGGVYCGDLSEGQKTLKPLCSFGRPLAQSSKVVPFIQGVSEEEPPVLTNYEKSWNYPALSDQLIDALNDHLANTPSIFQIGFFDIRGAACRSETAYPVRRPGVSSWIWGFWRSATERKATVDWVDQTWSATTKYSDGVYVNDLDADESEARIRSAYGANYARLVALKNKYDPTNFFRMNQNIRPA